MPHIDDASKVLLAETKRVTKMGELCFAFAEGICAEYKREPRWGSIHNVARALFINPYHEQWSHDIIQKYAIKLTQADVRTAAFLAFLEFYRVVGGRYEDGAIELNGNAFAGLPIPSLGEGVVVPTGRLVKQALPTVVDEPVQVTTDSKGNLMPVMVKRGRGRPKKVVA